MSYSFRGYTSNETGKVGDQQLTPDVTVSWGGGAFLPNFQTKFPVDKKSHKLLTKDIK